MPNRIILAAMLTAAGLASGCRSAPPQTTTETTTGFLSDYSQLEPSEMGLRYVDLEALANYRRFIVEPIQVYFYDEADLDAIKEEDLVRLSDHMEAAIRAALGDSYEVVSEPAPGVAHLRIALTDLERSGSVLSVIPSTMPASFGMGGATMEAELMDSLADEQIAALVEAQEAGGFALDDPGDWAQAEAIIDRWAAALRARLDEAHQR